jgi:hypothetical protein
VPGHERRVPTTLISPSGFCCTDRNAGLQKALFCWVFPLGRAIGREGGLQVQAEATALEVQRTYKLTGGKIAQVAINTHPALRFRHSMTMRRVKG